MSRDSVGKREREKDRRRLRPCLLILYPRNICGGKERGGGGSDWDRRRRRMITRIRLFYVCAFFVSLSHDVNEYILQAHGRLPLTRDLIYKFNYARSPVGGVVSCSFSRLTDLA